MNVAPVANRTYPELLAHLSARSVTKHFDAYADVAWEDPSHRVDPEDARFELGEDDPLEETDWYRAQPPAVRARVGLHMVASMMKTGVDFEAILSRGLLELTSTLPNGSPEFRYAYHELIEEGQHSLMFQEFVNRTQLDVHGLTAVERVGSRLVPRLGRVRPERFFVHVIAGEWPVDYVQRAALARSRPLHPLLRRIMQIHVIEEARHLCFATRYLEEHVPRLGPLRRGGLALLMPFILKGNVSAMLRIPPSVIRAYRIPPSAVREAYASPRYALRVKGGLSPARALAARLGLVTARTATLWRWLGIPA